jgi:hypothetical protein
VGVSSCAGCAGLSLYRSGSALIVFGETETDAAQLFAFTKLLSVDRIAARSSHIPFETAHVLGIEDLMNLPASVT